MAEEQVSDQAAAKPPKGDLDLMFIGALLGGTLESFRRVAKKIRPEFLQGDARRAYEFATEYERQYRALPSLAAASGRLGAILEPASESVDFLAGEILTRRIGQLLTDTIDQINRSFDALRPRDGLAAVREHLATIEREGLEGIDYLDEAWESFKGQQEEIPEWIPRPPEKRRFLLTVGSFDGRGGGGVVPSGEVALIAGAGGGGKTWLLTATAISVATGRPLFDMFQVASPGHVALCLAEEDRREIEWRLHWGAKLLKLDRDEQRLLAQRVLLLPLQGQPVGLVSDDPENVAETRFAAELRRRLDDTGVEWRLIVLDPLARFAGPDAEKDAAAATRFVQVLETFTRVRGRPTVMASHHTTKASREGSGNRVNAARGSSALVDAPRFVWTIEPPPEPKKKGGKGSGEDDDLGIDVPYALKLEIVKSNYGIFCAPVWLVRDAEHHGALRNATRNELRQVFARFKKEREPDRGGGEPENGPASRDPDLDDIPL